LGERKGVIVGKYKTGDPLPAGLNVSAFDEWVAYRDQRKKPLSDLAKTKVINKLVQHQFNHQQKMVDTAIENDWVGLHEVQEKPELKPARSQKTRDLSLDQMLNDTSWAK
jgi:hypothetical protein